MFLFPKHRLHDDIPSDPADPKDPPADPKDPPADPPKSGIPAPGPDPRPGGPPPDWPEDWREKLAGDDEGYLNVLKRFGSPQELAKGHRTLYNERRSGDLIKPPPKDADEETLKQWRSENNVPLESAGYLDELPEKVVVGEQDKPIIDSMLSKFHDDNMPKDQAQRYLEHYLTSIKEDVAIHRGNFNQVHGLLDLMGEDLKERMMNARYADQTGVVNDPDFWTAMLMIANTVNPAGTLDPSHGANQLGTVEDRIAEIERMMRTNRRGYNANEKVQAEYRKLLDAQEKLKARAG